MSTPETGFWGGSISYQPAWASAPFTIPFGEVDAFGVGWVLQKFDGWTDSPTAVGQVVQRTADHGGWPSPQYHGPRIITLTLWASAPDQASRDAAVHRLMQAVPVGSSTGDLATLTINESTPQWAMVRRNGSAQIAVSRPTLTDAQFTIPLVAPDPRRYSTVTKVTPTASLADESYMTIDTGASYNTLPWTMPANVVPGTVTVTNDGTLETRPVITLIGPLSAPAVTNQLTGQAVSWSALSMGSGDQLVIDFDSCTASLNGAYYPADVTSSWWVLQPGTQTIALTGNRGGGGGSMSVTFYDAYV